MTSRRSILTTCWVYSTSFRKNVHESGRNVFAARAVRRTRKRRDFPSEQAPTTSLASFAGPPSAKRSGRGTPEGGDDGFWSSFCKRSERQRAERSKRWMGRGGFEPEEDGPAHLAPLGCAGCVFQGSNPLLPLNTFTTRLATPTGRSTMWVSEKWVRTESIRGASGPEDPEAPRFTEREALGPRNPRRG